MGQRGTGAVQTLLLTSQRNSDVPNLMNRSTLGKSCASRSNEYLPLEQDSFSWGLFSITRLACLLVIDVDVSEVGARVLVGRARRKQVLELSFRVKGSPHVWYLQDVAIAASYDNIATVDGEL